MKKLPHGGPTNIRHHGEKFNPTGDLAPGILFSSGLLSLFVHFILLSSHKSVGI